MPPKSTMPTLRAVPMVLLMAMSALLLPSAPSAATPINKCTLHGEVTFQTGPCPVAGGPRPTVAQLNAARQKRLAQDKARAASAAEAATAATAPTASTAAPATLSGREPRTTTPPAGAATAAAAVATPRCDGRTYCSQMTSCEEATYFLRHCPGVKMDGDGNGMPCEKQWCGR